MLRSNAAGTYVWFSIHDTHLSDKRVGGWDRKRGHRGTPRIVHKRRARRARNGTQMALASRCVYSAAVTTAAVQTATCPLSHLSGLSCQSSGDSGGGELGGDSRCTITWISLGWGVGMDGGPGLGVGRYPAAAGRKPARGVGRYALARGVSDRYGTVTRPLRQLAATRDS